MLANRLFIKNLVERGASSTKIKKALWNFRKELSVFVPNSKDTLQDKFFSWQNLLRPPMQFKDWKLVKKDWQENSKILQVHEKNGK